MFNHIVADVKNINKKHANNKVLCKLLDEGVPIHASLLGEYKTSKFHVHDAEG